MKSDEVYSLFLQAQIKNTNEQNKLMQHWKFFFLVVFFSRTPPTVWLLFNDSIKRARQSPCNIGFLKSASEVCFLLLCMMPFSKAGTDSAKPQLIEE